MKQFNLIFVFTILFAAFSCHSTEEAAPEFNKDQFLESVAIVGPFTTDLGNGTFSKTVEIKDMSGSLKLSGGFKINGSEYSDKGLFNDQIAGDGIYTSVEVFNSEEVNQKLPEEVIAMVSPKFKYADEPIFSNYASINGRTQGGSIKIGCESITLEECRDEHWWDTDLFGEPCIYLSGCSFDFEWTW